VKFIKFIPGAMEGSLKRAVLMKFPDFSLSIIETERGLFAEIVEKKERRTFKAEIGEENLEGVVEKVMDKLGSIVEIYQKE